MRENTLPPNDLITSRQATEEGASLSTIKRMLRRGELRRYRRLNRVLVSRAEVRALLTPKLVSA